MPLPVNLQKQRKEIMKDTRMSPSEYCAKWIPILYGYYPGEHGYRTSCVIELAHITGFLPASIQNWGKDLNKLSRRSRYLVEGILARQDAINETDKRIQPFMDRPHLR